MNRDIIRQSAKENSTNIFMPQRHVEVAVRKYDMLQNISGKTVSEVAQFFNVSDDDITKYAWVDFLAGMQDALTKSVYADQQIGQANLVERRGINGKI